MLRILCIVLVMLLSVFDVASAVFPQWFEVGDTKFDAQLYNAADIELNGHIVWTIEGFWPEEPNLVKAVSLSDGVVQEWTLVEGYIIQKDSNEFDGVLYAVENSSAVEIWHIREDTSSSLIKRFEGILPYYDMGLQTIRAYMNGMLYYIKALENTGISYAQRGEEKVYVPAARNGVLCRLDAYGNEYVYQLNNYAFNAFGVSQSLISAYAIASDGKLAWAEVDTKSGKRATNIYVEIPGQGIEQIIGIDECAALECTGISSRYMAWLDDDTLLFAVKRYLEEQHHYADALYSFFISSGKYSPLTNEEDEQIYCWNEIALGSNMLINQEGTILTYMGQPNQWGDLGDDVMTQCSVPILIDLRTGIDYVCYQNKAMKDEPTRLLEVRNNAGKLCLID